MTTSQEWAERFEGFIPRERSNINVPHLERRLTRVRAMRMADKNRFKPNPNGDGYLTREERWNELIWAIEAKIISA